VNKQSFRVRFLSTLVSNILRFGLLFISGVVIARALGPGDYGNFGFLLGSFTALANLVDMASSSAFYTFISQKKRGQKFYYYYTAWIFTQFLILLFFVLLLPAPLKGKIWLGHPRGMIILALFASFSMRQIWEFVGRIGESIRDTVSVQIWNVTLALTYLTCIVLLVRFHLVNIKFFFIANGLIYVFFAFSYAMRLSQKADFYTEKTEDLGNIFREFADYCLPLILYTGIGFLYSFADYWLLQRFGGAIQQGFYGIGVKFSSLSLIATTSILAVFWKEVAEAHTLENMDRVRMLYCKVSRGLYFIGAVLSCLLIPFSNEILSFLLGPSYQPAWLPLSIMLLYPVHQSLGQITGIMFRATGQTKTHSKIGIFSMAISIPITYLLLAPSSSLIPGLHLGALGLAIKMVICQLVTVNLMTFFVAKYINMSFDWSYQINILLLLLPMGFLSKICTEQILSLVSFPNHPILLMAISGILYFTGVTALSYSFPSIAGINKEQIEQGLLWMRGRLKLV